MKRSAAEAVIGRIILRKNIRGLFSGYLFRNLLFIFLCMFLATCSGGGGGGSTPQVVDTCGVEAQKEWVLDQVRDWYLFPDTLPNSVDTAWFSEAQELLDYLTQGARAQGKDRYFSYLTTTAEDTSFFQEGQYVGYGFGLALQGTSPETARLFVRFSFEESPADLAGLGRGAEIMSIDDGSGFRSITTIMTGGRAALESALGPAEQGVRRGFRWIQDSFEKEAYLTQEIVTIVPIPKTQGTAVLPLAGTAGVGYLQLLTFISPAEIPLREAFDQFLQQGITDFIIDLRYNGGGLLRLAKLMGDLLGQIRSTNDVFYRMEFNAQHSLENVVAYFKAQPESVAPLRIAFITTNSTASASELVVNSLKPYAQVAIVGSDTYGKPLGQIRLQMEGCDTLLRLIAFRTVNSLNEGDYYQGLAETLPEAACLADDDLTRLPGDMAESSTQTALDWLSNGSCQSRMPAASLEDLPPRTPTLELEPRPRSALQANMPGVY